MRLGFLLDKRPADPRGAPTRDPSLGQSGWDLDLYGSPAVAAPAA